VRGLQTVKPNSERHFAQRAILNKMSSRLWREWNRDYARCQRGQWLRDQTL